MTDTITAITVGINDFARRHTRDSKFSHYDGDIDHVAVITQEAVNDGRSIMRPVPNREGVFLVCVPANEFYSGVVLLQPDMELKATFEARRENEDPFIQVVAIDGSKLPAKYVDICLYSRKALAGNTSTDCDFEVVSINASPVEGEEPPTPMAMARNFLNLPGGSPAEYTAEEFAEAIIYWSRRAMCG